MRGGDPRGPILPSGVEDTGPREAERLVREDLVKVLDVREPGEHVARHIPGSVLIPLSQLPRRCRELDPDVEWLVYCEHGIRSVQGSAILRHAGVDSVRNLRGGISRWEGPTESHQALFDEPGQLQPNAWLLEHLDQAPPGLALDVACGWGRNALALAYMGWSVDAVDASRDRLERLSQRAAALNLPVRTHEHDLESGDRLIEGGPWQLVVVVHYLHRGLFSALREAVAPGGLLLYETFTTLQAGQGKPTNPDYLLREGELVSAFSGWEILDQREGEAPPDGGHAGSTRWVASLAARRPTSQGVET